MAKYTNLANVYEEHPSRRERVNPDVGIGATVVLRCAWDQRWNLVDDLYGVNAIPYPNTPAGWVAPMPTQIGIQPDETKFTTDVDGQIIEYEEALVTVQYAYVEFTTSAPGQPPDTRVLLVESLEPNAEFLTIDPKHFRWVTPDPDETVPANDKRRVKQEETPGKLMKNLNLVRTYTGLRTIPSNALTLSGLVNDSPYVSALLGLTFPTETLLFNPPSINRTFTASGVKGWNVTVRFSHKAQTWNKFWRSQTGTWDEFRKIDSDGNETPFKLYQPGDFSSWLW